MEETFGPPLTAETIVEASIEKVWACWNNPDDIRIWNNPSPEWYTSTVDNDLRPGGRFLYRMGLLDGSLQFDFEGTYDIVVPNRRITYTLGDGRTAEILFNGEGPVRITEIFVPENSTPVDIQEEFCASVLAVFKQYVESKP